MSIAAKHAYRFTYLKSEQWSNVRIEALAREGGKCQICGEESISNDAHHIWYPENIYETTQAHLVILCRPCHDFTHAMLPDCKTRDETKGKEQWIQFRNAVLTWRHEKLALFKNIDGVRVISPEKLKEKILRLKQIVNNLVTTSPEAKKKVGKVFAEAKALFPDI